MEVHSMNKIKKLVVIALATTMLLGTTLTANAADYVIGISTTKCSHCHKTSAILREVSISANGIKYSWQCATCNFWTYTYN